MQGVRTKHLLLILYVILTFAIKKKKKNPHRILRNLIVD